MVNRLNDWLLCGLLLMIGVGVLLDFQIRRQMTAFGEVRPADVLRKLNELEKKVDDFAEVRPADVLAELRRLEERINISGVE